MANEKNISAETGTEGYVSTPKSNIRLNVAPDGRITLEDAFAQHLRKKKQEEEERLRSIRERARARQEQSGRDESLPEPGTAPRWEPELPATPRERDAETNLPSEQHEPDRMRHEAGMALTVVPVPGTEPRNPLIKQTVDNTIAEKVTDGALRVMDVAAGQALDAGMNGRASKGYAMPGTGMEYAVGAMFDQREATEQYYRTLTPESAMRYVEDALHDPSTVSDIMEACRRSGMDENKYINTVLAPQIQENIYKRLVERRAPKNTLEFVTGGLFNSQIGRLLETAMYPAEERQLRAAGRQAYAEHAGPIESIANEAVTLAGDYPLFAGIGKYAGLIGRTMGSMTRAAGMGNRAIQTAARLGAEATTFGVYETLGSINDTIHQTGDLDAEGLRRAAGAAVKGTVAGGLMGAFGTMSDRLMSRYVAKHGFGPTFNYRVRPKGSIHEMRATAASKWGADMAGKSAILAGSSIVGQMMEDPEFKWDDVDWVDEFRGALMLNLMLSVQGTLTGHHGSAYKHIGLTEQDLSDLRRAGMPVRTEREAYDYLQQTGRMDVMNSPALSLKQKNDLLRLSQWQDKDGKPLAIKENPTTQMRVGRTMDERWCVDEYDALGTLNDRHVFGSREEADAYHTAHEGMLLVNRLAALESVDASRTMTMATASAIRAVSETLHIPAGLVADRVYRKLNGERLRGDDAQIADMVEDLADTHQEYSTTRSDEVCRELDTYHEREEGWMKGVRQKDWEEMDDTERTAMREYLDAMDKALSGKASDETSVATSDDGGARQSGRDLTVSGDEEAQRRQVVRTQVARDRVTSVMGEDFAARLDAGGRGMLDDYLYIPDAYMGYIEDYLRQREVTAGMQEALDESMRPALDSARQTMRTMSSLTDEDGRTVIHLVHDGDKAYVVRKQMGDLLMVTPLETAEGGRIMWDSYDDTVTRTMKWKPSLSFEQRVEQDVIPEMVPEYADRMNRLYNAPGPEAGERLDRMGADGKMQQLTITGRDGRGNWMLTVTGADGKETREVMDDATLRMLKAENERIGIELENSGEDSPAPAETPVRQPEAEGQEAQPAGRRDADYSTTGQEENAPAEDTLDYGRERYSDGTVGWAGTDDTIRRMTDEAGGNREVVLRLVRNKGRIARQELEESNRRMDEITDARELKEEWDRNRELVEAVEYWQGVDNAMTRIEREADMPEPARRMRDMMEQLSKRFGNELEITDDMHGELIAIGSPMTREEAGRINGFYLNGRIVVNGRTVRGLAWAFGHESGHRIKEMDAASYKRWKDAILNTMGADRLAEEMARKRQMKVYRKATDDELSDEIANDQIGEILADPQKLEALVRSLNPNTMRSVWDTARKWVTDMDVHWTDVLESAREAGKKLFDDLSSRIDVVMGFRKELGDAEKVLRDTYRSAIETAGRKAAEAKELQAERVGAEPQQAARADVDTNPSEAQKKAGNYKKGHLRLDGYNISIENPKGSIRSGKDRKGHEWSVTMNNDYGYLRGTEGVDGDHIDVFLSDTPQEGDVYVIDQVNADGSFDEHKVMYGFQSEEEARRAYLSNYSEGWQGLGQITKVSREDFRKWVDSSHRKTKPFSEYSMVKDKDGVSFSAEWAQRKGRTGNWHNLGRKELNADNISAFLYGLNGKYESKRFKELVRRSRSAGGAILHWKDGKLEADRDAARLMLEELETNVMPMRMELTELRWSDKVTEAARREIDRVIYDIDYAENYYRRVADGEDVWKWMDIPRFSAEKDDITINKSKKTEYDLPLGKIFVSLHSERDREAVSGQRERMSPTAGWRDGVDDVVVHTTLGTLRKKYADLHEKAKSGDVEAAVELVASVVKEDRVKALVQQHPNAAVAFVHAEEATGRNKIPESYAYMFQKYGLPLRADIRQINKPAHTGSDKAGRLIRRARYDGTVVPGQEYILVDDHVTMGGTLRDLKDYIEDKGGKVVAVSTLTASAGGTKLRPTEEQIKELTEKGITNEQLREFGIADNAEGLTRSEAREILLLVDSRGDRRSSQGRLGSRGENSGTDAETVRQFSSGILDLTDEQLADNAEGLTRSEAREILLLADRGGDRGFAQGRSGVNAEGQGTDSETLRRQTDAGHHLTDEQPGEPGIKYSSESPAATSMAQRAVHGILMDEATPEQWETMIEKAGGLKADEEKWMGLREWLRGQDGKTLTKDEVADFVRNTQERHSGATDETLMGVHNISEDKLKKVIKMGGMANPSLAVIDTERGMHTDFGDISLIPRSTLIDTRTGRNAGTYTGDSYTPTYPGVERRLTKQGEKTIKRIAKETAGGDDELERHLQRLLYDYAEGNSSRLHLLYLLQKGKNPEIRQQKTTHSKEEFDAITRIFGEATSTMPFDLSRAQSDALVDLMVSVHEQKLRENARNVSDQAKVESFIKASLDEYRKNITDDQGRIWFSKGDTFVNANWRDEQKRQHPQPDWYGTDLSADNQIATGGMSEDYAKWKEDLFGDKDMKEMLYAGYDAEGNRRYVPNTVANASRLMNRLSKTNSYDQGGLNATRATLLHKMKSLDEIRRHRELLQGKEQYGETQQEMSDELYDIIHQISDMQLISDNRFMNIDYAEARLQEAITKRDPIGYLNREYGYHISKDSELAHQIMNFIEKAANLPVKYFETKFERPVGLNEFAIAIVPEGTSAEVVKALEDAGLDVRTYDSTGHGEEAEENRRKATMDAVRGRDDILFSMEGGHVFYSNALKAVEGIRQEKATPEQWLKMVEKAGGLKAGEDKWLGLSDWLKSQDKKTLTKQQVLDYIRENEIQVEEVGYEENADGISITKDEVVNSEAFQGLVEELTEYDEGDNPYINKKKFDQLKHEDNDFFNGFDIDYWGEGIDIDDPVSAALYLGLIDKNRAKAINDIRLQYTTEGLDNKREIALVVPTVEPWSEGDEIHFGDAGKGRAVAWIRFGDATIYNPKTKEAADEAAQALDNHSRDESIPFGRWIVEHERIMDNYREKAAANNATAQRVLVIDEIQSKRHQEGREHGYAVSEEKANADMEAFLKRMREKYHYEPQTKFADIFSEEEMAELERLNMQHFNATLNRSAIPDAPFDKNWHELAMKRMLRYAAENGYDKIAWTKGEQQAERYNLGHVVYQITSTPYEAQSKSESDGHDLLVNMTDGTRYEMFVQPDGTLNSGVEMFDGKNVTEVFGKSIGEKIMNAEEETEISGDDLRIGGEGMKGFYDQMLPRFMDKYGKKWGVKTGEVHLDGLTGNNGQNGLDMWSVDVTPEMKERVMEGQPLFSSEEDRSEYARLRDIVERPYRIEKLRDSKAVEITEKDYSGKYDLNGDAAQRWIKENLRGEHRINDTGETIQITKVGAEEVTSHNRYDEAHLKSIVAIPQMLENAIFIGEEKNRKDNSKFDSYRYYAVGMKIDGEDYTAKIVIGVKQGKRYYDHRLTQIEKTRLIDLVNQSAPGFTTAGDAPEPPYSVGKDKALLSLLQVNQEEISDARQKMKEMEGKARFSAEERVPEELQSRDGKSVPEARYSAEGASVFYSNASRAVEGIRQDKATPEQWLKMIEKAGGLKSGEDRWLGLSDWLKSQDKKTLTKQEVLDYIRENEIRVEEVGYSEYNSENNDNLKGFNDEFYSLVNKYEDELSAVGAEVEAFDQEMFEKYGQGWGSELMRLSDEDRKRHYDLAKRYDYLNDNDAAELAYSDLVEKYGDDFGLAFEIQGNGNGFELVPKTDINDEPTEAAKTYLDAENTINSTRLQYTTEGLDNKREIALVVPTIEPWNTSDDIHFGDAGKGRAVAWIRFGETTVPRADKLIKQVDEFEEPYKNINGMLVYSPKGEKYGGHAYIVYGKGKDGRMIYVPIINDKQIKACDTFEEAKDAMNDWYKQNNIGKTQYDKVLVIDEIQSKRHQEGREKGYAVSEEKANADMEAFLKRMREKYHYEPQTKFADIFSEEEMAELERLNMQHFNATLNRSAIPDAPFDKNWHELAMKRMLRYAAENGYDKIAWTKGAQQAERYNTGKEIDLVERAMTFGDTGETRYDLQPKDNSGGISLFVKDGMVTRSAMEEFEGKPLTDVVGKDLAAKMLEMDANSSMTIPDMLVGGEGMKGFYDQMLPRFMDKYGKKWGVKTGEIELPELEEIAQKMWSVDVTPEMRESVMEGQPMFSAESSHNPEMKKALRAMKDNSEALSILRDTKEHDITEMAATLLSKGGLLWADEGEGEYRKKGVRSMMGWSDGERRNFLGMFKTAENGGISVAQAGEAVEQACRDEGIRFDEDDPMAGVNAIQDVLGEVRSMSDLTYFVENRRIAQAYDLQEKYLAAQEADRDAYYRKNYGMPYEEYMTYMDELHLEQARKSESRVVTDDNTEWLKERNKRQAQELLRLQEKLDELKKSELGRPLVMAQQKIMEQQQAEITGLKGERTELKEELRSRRKYAEAYRQQIEVKHQLSAFVRERMMAEDMPFVSKRDLNRLVTAIERANNMEQLEEAMTQVKTVVNKSRVRHLEYQLDRLMQVKVQARNGRNMSIARNVDDRMRRIIEDMHGRVQEVGITGLEERLDRLMRQRRETRAEINDLRLKLKELTEERDKIHLRSLINDMELSWEETTDEIHKVQDQITERREQRQSHGKVNLSEEIADLQEKFDKAAAGEDGYVWTEADADRMIALKGLEVIWESKDNARDVSKIQEETKGLWEQLYKVREDMKSVREAGNTDAEKALKEQMKVLQTKILSNEGLLAEALNTQAESVQRAIDMMEDLLSQGRNNLKSRIDAQLLRRNEILRGAVRDVRREGNEPNYNLGERNIKTTPTPKLPVSCSIGSFEYMCRRLSQSGLEGKDGFLYKQFVEGKDGAMEAYNTYERGLAEQRDKLDRKVTELFGTKNHPVWGTHAWTLQAAKSDKVVWNSGVTVVTDGSGSGAIRLRTNGKTDRMELPLSKGSATYLYMLWKMDDGRMKLRAQGFDDVSMMEIEDFIGPEYKNLADWLQDEFLTETRAKYNERYVEMYNTSMARIAHYVPIRVNRDATYRQSDLSEDKNRRTTLEQRAGSLINRRVNLTPIDLTKSVFDVISEHVDDMERWYAYAPVRRDLDAILSSTYFRNQVDANHAGHFARFYDAAALATQSYEAPDAKYGDRIMALMTKGLTSGNIAFRLGTAIKQLLSSTAYLGYTYDPTYYGMLIKNMGESLIGRNIKWCIDHIPSFAARVDVGDVGDNRLSERIGSGRLESAGKFLQDMGLVKIGEDVGQWRWESIGRKLQMYTQIGMLPNRAIDAFTCSIGAKTVYDYKLRQLRLAIDKDPSLKEEGRAAALKEAERKAIMEADIFYNSTQQSSNPMFMSPMQVGRSAMDRAFTVYQNNNLGYVRKMMGNALDFLHSVKYKKMTDAYKNYYESEGYESSDAEEMARKKTLSVAGRSLLGLFVFGWLNKYVWDKAGCGFFGWLADPLEGADERKENESDKAYKRRMEWNDWLGFIGAFGARPLQGTPMGNALGSICQAKNYNPLLASEELDQLVKDMSDVVKDHGVFSQQMLWALTNRALRTFGGINMETLGNIYFGLEQMMLDGGEWDEKFIDLMFVLNMPSSQRTVASRNIYKKMYKDVSFEEYLRMMSKAQKYTEVGKSLANWFPWMETAEGSKYVRKFKEIKKEWDDMHVEPGSIDSYMQRYNKLSSTESNRIYQENLKQGEMLEVTRINDAANKWQEVHKYMSDAADKKSYQRNNAEALKMYELYQDYTKTLQMLKRRLDGGPGDDEIMEKIRRNRKEFLDILDEYEASMK